MNWYRQSQYTPAPLAIVSYNSYGELGISFNGGQKYVYPDVSPYYKEKIEFLLSKKNYKAVQRLLSNLSRSTKKEQLEPEPVQEQPPETPQKPQQGMFPFMKGSWFGKMLYATIWDTDSDGSFEDNLKAMAELEYKLQAINRWHFSGMPQRQANIAQKLEEELWGVIEEIKSPLENTFSSWLSAHALTDPGQWAEQRMDPYGSGSYDYIQSVGTEQAVGGVVSEYLRYKHNSQPHRESIEQGFSEMLSMALQQPDNFPSLQNLSSLYEQDQEEMYNNELYSAGFDEFGEMYVGQAFESEEAAEAWIEEQIGNFDLSEHMYDTEMSSFAPMLQNAGGSIERFLQELNQHIVFPMWMNYWGAMGIEGTRELAQDAYERLTNSSTLSETIVAINHALDVNHQNGQMIEHMETYSGLDDVNTSRIVDMMDNITADAFVPEWNEELKEIGVSVPKMAVPQAV